MCLKDANSVIIAGERLDPATQNSVSVFLTLKGNALWDSANYVFPTVALESKVQR